MHACMPLSQQHLNAFFTNSILGFKLRQLQYRRVAARTRERKEPLQAVSVGFYTYLSPVPAGERAS